MSSKSDLRRRIDALEARVAECEADEGHALGRIAAMEQRRPQGRIVQLPIQVSERLDVEMISMPVAEWEKHQAETRSLQATVQPNRHLIDHLIRQRDRLEAEVAGLRNSLAIRKEMHDEHKAEIEALKRQCAMQEATLREIRSDIGGLYQNLELPSAVREMLASSRGIRDQWIAERDARIERLEAALQGYRSGRLHTFKPESDPA